LDVTLEKGDDGLGITVAGYVSPDSTNNGKLLFSSSSSFLCPYIIEKKKLREYDLSKINLEDY